MSRLAPHRIAAAALASAALAVALPVGIAAGAPGNGNGGGTQSSNGNDGHVQIDGVPIDAGRDNDPHVGCPFTVEFFGFDPTQSATITVTPHAPTTGGSPGTFGPMPVTVNGPIPPGPGVGSTLDGYYVVTAAEIEQIFAGVTPQPQQGYHARIDVELTPSPTGPGDDKHHTIWIAPCSTTTGTGETTTTTTSSTTTTTLAGSTGNGGTTTTTTTTLVGGSSGNGGTTTTTTTTLVGGSSGNGGPVTLASGGGVGGSSGNGAPVTLAAGGTVGGSSGNGGPVVSATTVHTGMPFAGSRPYELGGLAAGLGMIGWGLELKRRSKRALTG